MNRKGVYRSPEAFSNQYVSLAVSAESAFGASWQQGKTGCVGRGGRPWHQRYRRRLGIWSRLIPVRPARARRSLSSSCCGIAVLILR